MEGVVKGVEKLGRRRVLLETLQMKSRMILTVVMGSVHIGERGMRIGQGGEIFDHIDRNIRPHFEHRGDFDDLGDIDRNLGSIKLKIPTFKGKTDPEFGIP
jgi:hypothetical protein